MKAIAQLAAVVGLVVWAVLAAPKTATFAMPTFAQAYGIDCSTCHTAVPALNAYGRYIQRTGYATLDRDAMKRAIPFWIGWNTAYDTQDPSSPHQIKAGNFALHAAGTFAPDWAFHAHQWLVHSEQPGGVDTLWVTYNNLLHHNGHLFIGKIEAPGPSAFSQWVDISPFATPELTVGEHTWQNDANRWGAKFAYVHGAANVEFGYLGADTDLNGATDWIPANGRRSSIASRTRSRPVPSNSESTATPGRSRSPKAVSIGTPRSRATRRSIRSTGSPGCSHLPARLRRESREWSRSRAQDGLHDRSLRTGVQGPRARRLPPRDDLRWTRYDHAVP